MFIYWIQQARRNLAVVNIGRNYSIMTDNIMVVIDADTIFIARVINVVLLAQLMSLSLLQSTWILISALWQPH